MFTKFIIFVVVILILLLVAFLLHGTMAERCLKAVASRLSPRRKKKGHRRKKDILVTDPPTIYVKQIGEEYYQKVDITNYKFTIGNDSKNDLVLSPLTVEPHHATILKKIEGDVVYYVLVNYGKVNPVKLYRPELKKYQELRYRDQVILDRRTAFTIGNIKLIVTTPLPTRPTGTELVDTPPKTEEKVRAKEGEKGSAAACHMIFDQEPDV